MGTYSTLADYFLAVICIFCATVGVAGNVIALRCFQEHRKDLPTLLYILIALFDIISCATCLPTGISYLHDREPMWFGNTVFCYAWGMLWAVIPFMTVFLVGVLSITRTISLLQPLRTISRRNVLVFVSLYFAYLVLWSTVPIVFKYGRFVYTGSDTYCWESTEVGWYSNMEIVNGCALLAFPIIPVIISCGVSTYCVLSSLRISSLSTSVRNMKVDATITIILITVTYIFLNIPIFVIWVLFIYDNFTVRDEVVLYYYSWGVCYVICVAFNATLNPFIYICRMEKFRRSMKDLFRSRALERASGHWKTASRVSGPRSEGTGCVRGPRVYRSFYKKGGEGGSNEVEQRRRSNFE